jgi:N-terminal region of Chorein or VPS13
LNREQLKIGLFSGNVVLKDLEVKGEALEGFNLPVTVKKGLFLFFFLYNRVVLP